MKPNMETSKSQIKKKQMPEWFLWTCYCVFVLTTAWPLLQGTRKTRCTDLANTWHPSSLVNLAVSVWGMTQLGFRADLQDKIKFGLSARKTNSAFSVLGILLRCCMFNELYVPFKLYATPGSSKNRAHKTQVCHNSLSYDMFPWYPFVRQKEKMWSNVLL